MVFWMGIYPRPFLKKMDSSVKDLLYHIKRKEKIFVQSEEEKQVLPKIDNLIINHNSEKLTELNKEKE